MKLDDIHRYQNILTYRSKVLYLVSIYTSHGISSYMPRPTEDSYTLAFVYTNQVSSHEYEEKKKTVIFPPRHFIRLFLCYAPSNVSKPQC